MIRVFIGFDPRETIAFHVLSHSIHARASKPVSVTPIILSQLKDVFTRERDPLQSTEFSFTRFYVPLICNYQGIAMFCDNDFLWKCDPRKLRKYINKKPLAVVKHEDYDVIEDKMDGVKNKAYPKKNWSSLMIFRCNQFKNKLNKENLVNKNFLQD